MSRLSSMVFVKPDDAIGGESSGPRLLDGCERAEVKPLPVDAYLRDPDVVFGVTIDTHDAGFVVAEKLLVSSLRNLRRLSEVRDAIVSTDSVDVVDCEFGVSPMDYNPRKSVGQPYLSVDSDPKVSRRADASSNLSVWTASFVKFFEPTCFAAIAVVGKDFLAGWVSPSVMPHGVGAS